MTAPIVGASKIARDITQQKKAEEARHHLAAIVESSGSGGIVTSRMSRTLMTEIALLLMRAPDP